MSNNPEPLILINSDSILKALNQEMIDFDKRETERLMFFKKQVENEKKKFMEEQKSIWRSFARRLKELKLLPEEYDVEHSEHYISLRDGVVYKVHKESKKSDPISELIKILIKD